MEYKHKQKIIVDTREQKSLQFPGWESGISRKALRTGDYSLEGLEELVAIERKSLCDMVMCTGSERERFKRCLDRLEKFKYKYIFLETDADKVLKGNWRSQVHPMQVVGFLNSIAVKRNIPVYFLSNPDATSVFLMNLFDKIISSELSDANREL